MARAPSPVLSMAVEIYLDHAASGRLHPAAAAAMRDWIDHGYGNPSGSHSVSRRARAALDGARDRVADFIGVPPGGVVFTSGGTEADNLAVLGPLRAHAGAVVVSAVEHPAVLESARASGREVRVAGVDREGIVDVDGLRALLDADVAVVSIQLVNNETGVVQPFDRLARRIRKWAPNAVIHTDAVQAASWMDLPSATVGADLISISGHKMGGPQGVGVLGVRGDAELAPLIHGGGQERERRSGTHNVTAIIGLDGAVQALGATTDSRVGRNGAVAARRDRLADSILAAVPGAVSTVTGAPRSPGHCHLRFPGIESEALLFLLDEEGVCASAGAACASGAIEPSPVLLAMGISKEAASGALRLTLGPSTTDEEVERASTAVVRCVSRLGGVRS